jgi:uncharacterized protein YrrD
LFHRIRQLRGFHIKDGTREIGNLWGFVIDRHTWTVSHIVVNTGGWFQDQSIIISKQALQKPLLSDKTLPVSLKCDETGTEHINSVDSNSSPFVTKLKISIGIPSGWALTRPTPMVAFPVLMARSFYEKVPGLSTEDQQDDTHAQSCRDIVGCQIHSMDGMVGTVNDLLLDDDCWKIRYVVLDTGRWFSGRKVIVSTLWLRYMNEDERTLIVSRTVQSSVRLRS